MVHSGCTRLKTAAYQLNSLQNLRTTWTAGRLMHLCRDEHRHVSHFFITHATARSSEPPPGIMHACLVQHP